MAKKLIILLFLIISCKSTHDSKELKVVKKNKQYILSDDVFFEQALNDKGGQGNPVPMDKEFLVEIFKEASS